MRANRKSPSSSTQRPTSPADPVGESVAANDKNKQPAAQGHANPSRAVPSPAEKQWREQQLRVDATPEQARDIAQDSDSPALAKHVAERAEENVQPPPAADDVEHDSDQDAAARQVGFESFAALVEQSVAIAGPSRHDVFVCELPDGRWIRFERASWPKFAAFLSREEAIPEHTA